MSYVLLKLNLSFVGYQSLLYHLMVNELWNYFLARLILRNIEMYLKTKLIMRYLHTQPCTFSRKTFKSEGNKIYIWYISPPPFPQTHRLLIVYYGYNAWYNYTQTNSIYCVGCNKL